MKCPQCGGELKIGDIPVLHMERYGNSVLVATECCGQPVKCRPVRSYTVEAYDTKQTEDDWGTPFKKEKK